MSKAGDHPEIEMRSRAELRVWLSQHHATSETIWLVTWKKGTPFYVPFPDFVEELLCWGWIDSVPRKVDSERSATRVSRRKPKSAWSGVNKRLVEKARSEGAMTEAGEAAIAVAKENGMWTFLDDVEAGVVPDDLGRALGPLRERWDDWPKTYRRAWLEKIKSARTGATREKRIATCASAASADTPKAGLS